MCNDAIKLCDFLGSSDIERIAWDVASVWHSASYIINDHLIQVSYFSPGAIEAGIETAYSPSSQRGNSRPLTEVKPLKVLTTTMSKW